MVPPPPTLFTTCSRTGASFSWSMICATVRPKMSGPEPGPLCTTISIGRVGLNSADAGQALSASTAVAAARIHLRFIGNPPVYCYFV